MTAINDLVEVAGSMRITGRFGALTEAAAGISVPFSVLYESMPRVTIPVSAMSLARAESPSGQSLPVDIYSLIEEVRRSISELKARTASVPDIYTYYIPQAAQVIVPALPAMPGPVSVSVESPPAVYISERSEPADKRPEAVEHADAVPAKPVFKTDEEILRSNLALGRLREDYALLTLDLTEVERLIGEAMRSSSADIPAIAGMRSIPAIPETGVRDAEVSRHDMAADRPPKLASVLAQGVSLPEAIRKSTVEMLVMQTVLSAEVPSPAMIGPVQAATVPEPMQPVESPVAERSAHSTDLVPDKISSRPAAIAAPVAQALDISRMFNGLVGSYLALRGTAPGRSAVREGVTQLLLSLPEQQAVEGPAAGLFDVIAGLQSGGLRSSGLQVEVHKTIERLAPMDIPAHVPVAMQKPIETLQTIEVNATAPAAAMPQEDGPMRDTILGDLREIQGTMLSLQDAVGGLRKAGMPLQEVPGAIESPAAVLPGYEGAAGELSVIQASIARLQAAMDFLRYNVPTLADFVVIQKAVLGFPPVAAAMPDAGTPMSIAIEGVQPKSAAPISMPDLSWVTREFGQMQGMIARLQVPMYAGGGLVQEPTLAFVGESEPEWIVPMSAWDASQSKLNEFYHLLWAQIQDLGTSMQATVDGVNTALESVQAGGTGGGDDTSSGEEDVGTQVLNTMQGLIDKYLGMVGLSVETLKNAPKTAGMGVVLGAASVALPYAKDTFLGTDEEEDEKDDSGGDEEETDEEDDEEDFWDMIDGLEDAASISDKRDGKFGDGDDENE